jgi:predicted  nucleic acid-binding Zn-ribbon protein
MKGLSESVLAIAHELHEGREQRKTEFDWLRSHAGLATRQDLEMFANKIMSAISDYAAAQAAFNTEVSSDLDAIQTAITALNAQITTLQNSPGPISPADQATLNDLQTAGKALQDKADALAGKTPPTPPAS